MALQNIVSSAALAGPFLIAMLVAIAGGSVIAVSKRALAPVLRERDDSTAVQASHVGEPLRLGGLAIFAALIAGLWAAGTLREPMVWLLLLSALPALAAGLSEDLGYHVSPARRLLAAAISGLLAVAFLELWVPRSDLPGLDQAMTLAVVAVGITVLVSAGFCHAVNLTDGMNGLAATIIVTSAIGLALVAGQNGLGSVATMCLLLAAAAFGFLVLNWPLGKLFLGDAGSYGLGHVLIWLSFVIAATTTAVAIPALLLILFWPFADTLHTMLRRAMSGMALTQPDRMHLHQKVRRALEITWLGVGNRAVSNPLTTVLLAPMVVAPVWAGVALMDRPLESWLALIGFGFVFSATSIAVTWLAMVRRSALAPRSAAQSSARYANSA